jgi:microsomal epoxide hydrolase
MIGIHLNAAGGAVGAGADATDEERNWQRASAAYRTTELDYFNEQQHKPQTVSFALYDNPLGTAAWIAEKLRVWTDSGSAAEPVVSKDQVLTNVMIYLVTDTAATGVWFYRGSADDQSLNTRPGKVTVPTGFASFPAEMPPLNPPRSVLERGFNLVHYTKMPRGGHFACLEQPQLFVDDVRAFFRKLRA